MRPPTRAARPVVVSYCLFAASGVVACTGHRAVPGVAPPAPIQVIARAPLVENEDGVIGGPADDTDFVFDVDVVDGPPPDLEGTPELDDSIVDALRPYLDAQRVSLAGSASGGGLVVVARTEDVAQAHLLEAPGRQLVPLTDWAEPVHQAALRAKPTPVLYFRSDHGGDEQHSLYRVDLDGSRPVPLTRTGVRTGPFLLGPDELVAYSANARRESAMDVYVRRGRGEQTPMRVLQVDGSAVVRSWSSDGKALIVHRYVSVDESWIDVVDLERERTTTLAGDEPAAAHTDARFAPDGGLFVLSDRGGEWAHLYQTDRDGSRWRDLTPELDHDVEGFAVSSGGDIVVVVNDDGYSRMWAVDSATATRRLLPSLVDGVVTGLRFVDARKLAFTSSRPTSPSDVYSYDLDTETAVAWTATAPSADSSAFVTPRLLRVPSFDGEPVPLVAYVPRGEGPFAVLLWIHGGPEEQTRPTFNPMIQFLVSQGIAVVAPNVRGSTGYGRRFRGLDNGVRRQDAIADIGAVLDWVEQEPELDAGRVGIHGASYGGYVVLASLVAYPDRIRAGCDVVGVSDFVTFLENTREYRRDLRRVEYGDERDPEVRAFLHEASPLTHAASIRSALFVAHGANDPRVPVSEAHQIVEAARATAAQTWFMLAHDEGHGFRRKRNRDLFYALMVQFFRDNLREVTADDPSADEPTAEEPSDVAAP